MRCPPTYRDRFKLGPNVDYRQLVIEDSLMTNDGPISLVEAVFLSQLVRDLRGTGLIIEIGTLFGYSTGVMATAKSRDRKLVTVDDYSWNPFGLSREAHYRITEKNLLDAVTTLNVDQLRISKEEFYARYEGPAPALVFLDADHSYEETRRDIDWARSVGSDVISGHDFDDRFPGVVQSVTESGGPSRIEGTLWVL